MYLFTKESAVALTRTVVTFAYAWLITNIPFVGDWLTSSAWIDESLFVLVGGGLLYQLVRSLAEKFAWLGYVLIFNTKPSYEV